MKCLRVFSCCLCVAALAGAVAAEDWPCWRGPRGDGTSLEEKVPLRWGESEHVLWKTLIPGNGHASPVVWGGRVFVVTALEDKLERCLLALERDSGKILWQRTVITSPLEGKHGLNGYASSTPATDGERVYVAFLDRKEMVVAAYDFEGNRKWLSRPGSFASMHGFCSSPVLYQDKVIVNGDHDGDAYIVALDRATGNVAWKVERENKTRSYCVPVIFEHGGKARMVLSGSKSIAGFDPATGERQWVLPDLPSEQTVASVVWNAGAGLLFVTGGYPRLNIVTLKPDGAGVLDEGAVVWRSTKGVSYVPSPVSFGPWFLVVNDSGLLSCFQAADGKLLWQERLGGPHHASLVAAAGHVYCLSDAGVTTVVKPGPVFEAVARNAVGEKCFASPAVSGGRMYLRGDRHLWCVGGAE